MKVKSLYILILACSLSIGGIVTYFAYSFSVRIATQDAEARFHEMAIIRLVAIRAKLQDSQDILLALKAFFESSDDVTPVDFTNFATILTKNNPQISSLAWFQKNLINSTPVYKLKYSQSNGDLNAHLDIEQSLFPENAPNTISATMSQSKQDANLAVFTLPVFSVNQHASQKNKVNQIGFVVMLIDLENLLKQSLDVFPLSPINLSIKTNDQLLAEVKASLVKLSRHETNAPNGTSRQLNHSKITKVSDSEWEINASSNIEAFYELSLLTKLSLGLGLLFTLLMSYIVHMMMRRHIKVIALVEKKTFDLQHAYQMILKQSKHLESEVAKRTHELMIAKEKAENANKEKSVFLSSMTHELKTPLNAILGFAQVLKNDSVAKLNEDQEDSVKEILNAGEHLSRLITEVLDLAKLDALRDKCLIESVSLGEILNDCIRMVQTQSTEQNITIHIADSCNVKVLADDIKLKQLILNFVTNAIKYNKPKGHIYIEGNATSEGKFRLSVKDTGLGIAQDKHNLIFKAFSRLGMEKTTIEGTGIGLVVTKEIIELLNGQIGFDSKLGKGSTFWFELPLASTP